MGIHRVGQKLSRLHHQLGSSPLILFILGIAVLFLFACATLIQIQTSEYLALGTNTRVAGVAWNVLLQPWWMITGQAPIAYATAWLYGWVVEVITLVFALALSVAIFKLSDANPHLSRGFVAGGVLLIVLNSWADYSASPGNNPLVQFLIALAVGGMAVVGLPLGIGLIERGFEEL
jgi:hypothetical protein